MGVLENLITKNLNQGLRVQNIKIPAYGGEEFEFFILPEYQIYNCDGKIERTQQRARSKNPLFQKILRPVLLIIKTISLIVQAVWSLSLLFSVVGLISEAIQIATSYTKNNEEQDPSFFGALLKTVRIYRKPSAEYKKLKKIFYIVVDRNTSNKTKASLLQLAALIHHKHILDTALVILAKNEFTELPQQQLQILSVPSDNAFAIEFGMELYQKIRSGQYTEASLSIKRILEKEEITDIGAFEFLMQCLAFCYTKINRMEFIGLFENLPLKADRHLQRSTEIKFTRHNESNSNFLQFCYTLLEQYYREKSSALALSVAETKKIIYQINDKLKSLDDYFNAALLLEKFGNTDEVVSEYILAYFHMEYISHTLSDDAVVKIDSYREHELQAEYFIKLLDPHTRTRHELLTIFHWVKDTDSLRPIVKLCYLYLLVNPFYKNNLCEPEFLKYYRDIWLQTEEEPRLKELFLVQFLLYFTVIDDYACRSSCAKFAQIELRTFLANRPDAFNGRLYIKVCRSLNGLRVDQFSENLIDMLAVKQLVKTYPQEEQYYNINLGALFAYNNRFQDAIKTYKAIDARRVKNDPELQFTLINNLSVFQYLKSPTLQTAKREYIKLRKNIRLCKKSNVYTEEIQHLTVNSLVLGIASGLPTEEIQELFSEAKALVKGDEYYEYHINQAEWLFLFLYQIPSPFMELETRSAFFRHKTSFFAHKKAVMEAWSGPERTLTALNEALKSESNSFGSDYDYYKRGELFTLIERWYE